MDTRVVKKHYKYPAMPERIDEWEEVRSENFNVRFFCFGERNENQRLMVASESGPISWPSDQPEPHRAKSHFIGASIDVNEVDELIEILQTAKRHFCSAGPKVAS